MTFCMAECNRFKIYYIPLDAQLYVPPTPEYIEKHGAVCNVSSCELTNIFDGLDVSKGHRVSENDLDNLRIRIINEHNKEELYITSDKTVLYKNKSYQLKAETIDLALQVIISVCEKPVK